MSTIQEISAAVRKLSDGEFVKLRKWIDGLGAKRGASRIKSKSSRRGGGRLPRIETYSSKRVAEFLLSNSVDAEDYARACEEVRRMGLKPAEIQHYKPPGVR